MNKKYQLILLLIMTTPVFAGFIEYNNTVNKAEWLYDNGQFVDAKNEFDLAFEEVEIPKTKDIFIYVLILKGLKQENKIYRILKIHLKNIEGVDKKITPYLEKEGICMNDFQSKKLNSILLDTTSLGYRYKQYQLSTIDRLYNNDQNIRMKFGEGLANKHDLEVIANLNTAKILEMFEEDNLLLNDRLDHRFYTLLIHMTLKNFSRINSYLLLMLDNGNLEPWYYACAWDRSHFGAGECLKYFAYIIDNDNLNCIEYEKILENRKQIGLSIFYSRPSFRFYVPVNRMMKKPFLSYYKNKISTSIK
jgi:hypothetical protein